MVAAWHWQSQWPHGVTQVRVFVSLLPILVSSALCRADVVAVWLFDEPKAAYPSSLVNDAGPNHYTMALGRGAKLVDGRFGNALRPDRAGPLVIRSRVLDQVQGKAP